MDVINNANDVHLHSSRPAMIIGDHRLCHRVGSLSLSLCRLFDRQFFTLIMQSIKIKLFLLKMIR